jgi:hypothetical protein
MPGTTSMNAPTYLPGGRSMKSATTQKPRIRACEFTLNFNVDLFSTLFWYDESLTGPWSQPRF